MTSDAQLDKRLIERNLRKGTLQRKDLEKHLAGLPDRADNAAPMSEESAEGEVTSDASE